MKKVIIAVLALAAFGTASLAQTAPSVKKNEQAKVKMANNSANNNQQGKVTMANKASAATKPAVAKQNMTKPAETHSAVAVKNSGKKEMAPKMMNSKAGKSSPVHAKKEASVDTRAKEAQKHS